MNCPKCGENKTVVVDKRHVGPMNWRRRLCGPCGHRFTTYERPAEEKPQHLGQSPSEGHKSIDAGKYLMIGK